MSAPLLYVMLVFGAYRTTRLLVRDYLLEPWRARLARSTGRTGQKFAYFLQCPFCVGAWVSAGLVVAVWAFRPLPLPLLWWPATAGAQAVLSMADTRLDRR